MMERELHAVMVTKGGERERGREGEKGEGREGGGRGRKGRRESTPQM